MARTDFGRSPAHECPLSGYMQELSIITGETAELKLSGEATAQLEVARLVHGDPNPQGPGTVAEAQQWFTLVSLELEPRALDLGSYIEVLDRPALNPPASFTLGAWVYPTKLDGRWQTLMAKWGLNGRSFGLFTAGNGVLSAAISMDGETVQWCAGRQYLVQGQWQFVALVFHTSGSLTVYQYCEVVTELENHQPPTLISTVGITPGTVQTCASPLFLGAIPSADGTHWAHFNGKLAAPFLLLRGAGAAELERLRSTPPERTDPDLAAFWDLSLDVSTSRVVDISPNRCDGFTRNQPARAVTGPRWWGTPATLYTDDPSAYDAVHLHDDDLDDPGWPTSAEIRVPDDARSGIYAARVLSGTDHLTVPFIVSPRTPSADVCVVLPTLTWQAYSSNRGPYSFTEDGVIDSTLCIYDVHSDGSIVYYSTRRKPTRSGTPDRGIRPWGAHNLPADLYLIDWLDHRGHAYDVLCDQTLDTHEPDRLGTYACVILGSHPEYWTHQMLNTLECYLANGGRVMYLGGNGLYWVTSIDSERPWVMEVRKSGDGDFEFAATERQPGQTQHSTSLERGGLWSRRGRPARRLVGVEHSANVFVPAEGRWGFSRLEASYEPEFAFVFAGVDDQVIGDFGLNLGTAAGYEMDSVHEWEWIDDWRPTVLARASHPAIMSTMRLPVPRVADIAITASRTGAAVFAAGAVTWTGSLSHDGYDNNVSRITGNVLDRFLAVPRGTSVLSGDS